MSVRPLLYGADGNAVKVTGNDEDRLRALVLECLGALIGVPEGQLPNGAAGSIPAHELVQILVREVGPEAVETRYPWLKVTVHDMNLGTEPTVGEVELATAMAAQAEDTITNAERREFLDREGLTR